MGEEEANKMEASEPKEDMQQQPQPQPQPVKEEEMENEDEAGAEKKSVIIPLPQKVAAAETPPSVTEKSPNNRDSVLARVETEKRLALVKAWEENEKAKIDNKAYKKISAIGSWENTKKSAVEAQLKSIEEKLEKKKEEYAERMKNKVAQLHKQAEERRAMIEAKKGEDFLKIEETAAKFRSTGYTPKKFLGCFGS
ncbi:hypothetical protein ERO13_D12G229200v2 [Gossypium hirsutum]|uniref:Remorin 1.4 n=3 Tax=Gossypium TaxID=3633 RepID=A0A1U8NDB4_GOSHI|nr:remorin 1.4 [Gossypium hirsutum]KAB2000753.1 hypothetical protein ES319_D12G253700v1 [Gossypium barbadense]KAG4117409.1 hypothetical protein ERO13_D12G229200v2 [Gossypium hirsutum]TYG42574.1 hypothetical protein ES288_D12G268000v1 [Gossypium darwinii]